jgi:hypothetical protein
MSELLVRPGEWTFDKAAMTESFLANIALMLGFTQKHKDFLDRVHDDIWGRYTPDNFYYESRSIVGKWPPTMQLSEISKYPTKYKQQLKAWYTELQTLDPMAEPNPLFSLMEAPISNTINAF